MSDWDRGGGVGGLPEALEHGNREEPSINRNRALSLSVGIDVRSYRVASFEAAAGRSAAPLG